MDEVWRILYVEDNKDLGMMVQEALTDNDFAPITLQLVSNFDDAREDVEVRRYDLLILDVFSGHPSLENERTGVNILKHLKMVRFTPTIFYTALPNAVEDEGIVSPFVVVLGKEGTGLDPLLNAVKKFIDSGLLKLNRGLSRYIDQIQLDYMEGFVSQHWTDFATQRDRRALAYLLTRRLAISLSGRRIDELAYALGEPQMEGEQASTELIHRMQFYILPPVTQDFLTGDIIEGEVNGTTRYRVLLTPSCDMVTGRGPVKADYVLTAVCRPLNDFEEYKDWLNEPLTKKKKEKLEKLLRNNRSSGQSDRYHYLPGVFHIPHMIVDFQQIDRITFDSLNSMTRHASLDSPYAEALLSRYNRYYARFGTPDLDIADVMYSLKSSTQEEISALNDQDEEDNH